MKKYKQLTYKERYQIYALIKEGFNYTQIANNIGYSKSTISREIKRNSINKTSYHPDSASVETFVRHKNKTNILKLIKQLKNI